MQIEYERGISNPGNLYRMKKLMARAEAGETLNIGFLGGSITQGCLASAPELCYAYRVFQWWEKTFPQAKFHYINAGIGAPASQQVRFHPAIHGVPVLHMSHGKIPSIHH